jgi:hypothetical protein
LSATLGPYRLTEYLTQIRTEVKQNSGLSDIVEILAGAEIKISGATIHGLVLAVDTIMSGPMDFWDAWSEQLEKVRGEERRVFFSVISKHALEKSEPEWAS